MTCFAIWCFYAKAHIHTTSRLTITLSESRYRALKEAAARRHKTIGQLVDESLEFYGIKSHDEALELIRRAREHSRLDEAIAMALRETRAVRHP